MNKFAQPSNKFQSNNQVAAKGNNQVSRAPSAKGTLPTHLLKVKVPGEEKFRTLTGLFTKEGKGGRFLQGNDKDSGVAYYIMTPRKDGEAHKLRIREVNEAGEQSFRDIASLEKKTTSAGVDYLSGSDGENGYSVWPKD